MSSANFVHLFAVLYHSKKVAAGIAGTDNVLCQTNCSFAIDFIGIKASLHFISVKHWFLKRNDTSKATLELLFTTFKS